MEGKLTWLLEWCCVSGMQYYQSRIKCPLFMPKIQLIRVCGMIKNWPHIILKINKRKVPQIFCFLVWCGLIWTWPEVLKFWAGKADILFCFGNIWIDYLWLFNSMIDSIKNRGSGNVAVTHCVGKGHSSLTFNIQVGTTTVYGIWYWVLCMLYRMFWVPFQ